MRLARIFVLRYPGLPPLLVGEGIGRTEPSDPSSAPGPSTIRGVYRLGDWRIKPYRSLLVCKLRLAGKVLARRINPTGMGGLKKRRSHWIGAVIEASARMG